MFRISDLVDLPIKCLNGDKKIRYTVKSLLIDGNNNKIAALVCKEGTFKKYIKVIAYERIIAIDINGIIVADEHCVAKQSLHELNHYFQLEDIMNQLVLSNHGSLQGRITDIYINLVNGEIISYELSEGYLDDFINGRKIVGIEKGLKYNISSDGITVYQSIN